MRLIIFLMLIFGFSFGAEFEYKSAKDIKPLSEFKSIEEFEKNYKGYIQNCLDATYGGSAGIPCLIASEVWDRELNIVYDKLMKTLPSKLQNELKESQKEWIDVRDKTTRLAQSVVNSAYKGMQGTMYDLMQAQDSDTLNSEVIKNRTLLLREILNYYKKNVSTTQSSSGGIESYVASCEGGDYEACYNVGALYYFGKGVKRDYKKAFSFLKKSCDGEYADGCYGVGRAYFSGQGVKQDYEKAFGFLEKACEGKNESGCLGVAMSYEHGTGVKQDRDQAKSFYKKACDLGSQEACQSYQRLSSES
ncbi:MAG: lysozyme inhibitor LprI family protein [Campylobacterales bacterium]